MRWRTGNSPARGWLAAVVLGLAPCTGGWAADAAAAAAGQGVASSEEELRNTVINILDALVQKGILTREQATAIVANAQAKAVATAKEQAANAAANAAEEKQSLRVTYVPPTVQQEITQQVGAQVSKDVTAQVVAQARSEGWGVPGALPDWIRRIQFGGDVRVRGEYDAFASGNVQYFYINALAANNAGGVAKAGTNAFWNTTVDRARMLGRLRFGGIAQLDDSLRAEFRLVSGNLNNPVSTNQTFGSYDNRWQTGVDRAAIIWNPKSPWWRGDMNLWAGRYDNPFATYNELLWDQDVTFEGVSANLNWDRKSSPERRDTHWLFVTAGAFPVQEIELSTRDKWLYGAQVGTQIPIGQDSTLLLAGSYYDFSNVAGRLNAPFSNALDYTAPLYMQKGNTLFDIRNDLDPATNLFALAGNYELVSALAQYDMALDGGNHVIISGEYVNNVGWNSADVLARTGQNIQARRTGYEAGISVGSPRVLTRGQWRAAMSYRYLQRDAVLDAFTDSDFHLGGTDASGYILTVEYGIARSTSARLRYISANPIDGPPFGVDVTQLDLLGRF